MLIVESLDSLIISLSGAHHRKLQQLLVMLAYIQQQTQFPSFLYSLYYFYMDAPRGNQLNNNKSLLFIPDLQDQLNHYHLTIDFDESSEISVDDVFFQRCPVVKMQIGKNQNYYIFRACFNSKYPFHFTVLNKNNFVTKSM